MAEIINIFNKKDNDELQQKANMLNMIELIQDMIENDELTTMIISGNGRDGKVFVGHCNLDNSERLYLKSHLETDIIANILTE